MARPTSALDTVRTRVRRIQFTVGLGFLAMMLGNIVSAGLIMRLSVRFTIDSEAVASAIGLVLRMIWVVAILPVMAYGAARVLALKPWPTAIGAAATGQIFVIAVRLVSLGTEGLASDVPSLLAQAVLFALGIAATAWAVKSSREAVDQQQAQATKAAAAKKGEYDEFAKEAERLAAKSEAREAGTAAESASSAPIPNDAPARPEPAPAAPNLSAPGSPADAASSTARQEGSSADDASKPPRD